jgi:hypothetical protein
LQRAKPRDIRCPTACKVAIWPAVHINVIIKGTFFLKITSFNGKSRRPSPVRALDIMKGRLPSLDKKKVLKAGRWIE